MTNDGICVRVYLLCPIFNCLHIIYFYQRKYNSFMYTFIPICGFWAGLNYSKWKIYTSEYQWFGGQYNLLSARFLFAISNTSSLFNINMQRLSRESKCCVTVLKQYMLKCSYIFKRVNNFRYLYTPKTVTTTLTRQAMHYNYFINLYYFILLKKRVKTKSQMMMVCVYLWPVDQSKRWTST